jgi:hypothetical protein
MKNSFTILHIMKNILNNVKKIIQEKSGYKHKIRAFLLLKKSGREKETLALVEWDAQPVLLPVVEAASCSRRHETKHSLVTS